MVYKVVITTDAEEDLDGFIRYLLFEKQNSTADFLAAPKNLFGI